LIQSRILVAQLTSGIELEKVILRHSDGRTKEKSMRKKQ
jgi:hypothetical protein